MTHVGTVRMGDEPIIVTTYGDMVTIDDVMAGGAAAHALGTPLGGFIWMIDVRNADTNFGEMLKIFRATMSSGDYIVREEMLLTPLIFVGTHALIRMYVEMARHRADGGVDLPVFTTLEDALAAARTLLAARDRSEQPDA